MVHERPPTAIGGLALITGLHGCIGRNGMMRGVYSVNIRPMNLLKALATISSLTLVSRIIIFVREMLITRIFGAGAVTDAFFVAFKLPGLLRRLFAEGALSHLFVPIFGEYENLRIHDETKLLVGHVTGGLG